MTDCELYAGGKYNNNLEGGDYLKIMFTAPHNRAYDAEGNGMIRVHAWDEVVRIIDGMQSEGPSEPPV